MQCPLIQSPEDGLWRCPNCDQPPLPVNAHRTCEDRGVQFPPLHEQAANLLQAGADFVADGMRFVDKAEHRRRLAICEECSLKQKSRCAGCGCNLWLKVRLRSSVCPREKW